MFDRDKWNEIWATIVRNKTRSVLTAFGVSWGVLMFIILVGFGNGVSKGVGDQLEGLATNSMMIGCGRTSEPYKGNRIGRWWQFDSRDIELIRHKVPGVGYISPLREDFRPEVVRGSRRGNFSTLGLYPDYFKITGTGSEMLYGRLLNDMDIKECRKVCVLGSQVYETCFGRGEDPVGEKIRIGGKYYVVVGVSPPNYVFGMGNPLQTIYVPFTTQVRMGNSGDRFRHMMISAEPGLRISDLQQEIEDVIKANHDISPTDEKALYTFNAEEQVEMVFNVISGVNLLIWIIGMGALLSGVIGISNIMLVTVRERMREIGIRRALGARPFAIASQIMSESLVLTALAGMIGLAVGVLLLSAISIIMSANPPDDGASVIPYISFDLALAAVGILILSGLLAGLMPTWRALKIKAIDAIRDE